LLSETLISKIDTYNNEIHMLLDKLPSFWNYYFKTTEHVKVLMIQLTKVHDVRQPGTLRKSSGMSCVSCLRYIDNFGLVWFTIMPLYYVSSEASWISKWKFLQRFMDARQQFVEGPATHTYYSVEILYTSC